MDEMTAMLARGGDLHSACLLAGHIVGLYGELAARSFDRRHATSLRARRLGLAV